MWINDRAYDSDDMRGKGVKMVSSHRKNRKKDEDARRARAASLQMALDCGAVLRLDEATASAIESLGVVSGEFSKVCAGFCRDFFDVQAILR